MREMIAVNNLLTAMSTQVLKREALMFDRIAVPQLSLLLPAFKVLMGTAPQEMLDYEWLLGQGVLFEAAHDKTATIQSEEYQYVDRAAKAHMENVEGMYKEHGLGEFTEIRKEELVESMIKLKDALSDKVTNLARLATSEDFQKNLASAFDYHARGMSIELRELKGLDTYPILLLPPPERLDKPSSETDIITITLNALPTPDENTPWEQIFEFRNDPDSRDKFIDLKDWMRGIAKAQLSPKEAEDKLEYLLSRYRRHIELHKMKVKTGAVETILVTTGEMFEHLAHLEFGKLMKAPLW